MSAKAAEILIEEAARLEAQDDLRGAVKAVGLAADDRRRRVERNNNPNMAPVSVAQRRMLDQAVETRRLARELLRTGFEETN